MSRDNNSESSDSNDSLPAFQLNIETNQHIRANTNTDKIRLKNSIVSIMKENSEEFYDLITDHVFNMVYLKKNPPDHKAEVLDIIKTLEDMK
jgi:hypothetical protein